LFFFLHGFYIFVLFQVIVNLATIWTKLAEPWCTPAVGRFTRPTQDYKWVAGIWSYINVECNHRQESSENIFIFKTPHYFKQLDVDSGCRWRFTYFLSFWFFFMKCQKISFSEKMQYVYQTVFTDNYYWYT